MDVDRPLDDLISDKRKSEPRRQPRQSKERTERAAPTPYTRPPARSTEDKWVHDMSNPGARRNVASGPLATAIAGTGAVFTGVSPRIEVLGLHYEVTPADLKTIFSQAGTLVQGPTIRVKLLAKSSSHGSLGVDGYDVLELVEECCLCPAFFVLSLREATMEFASYQQAKIAINKFDGAMTKGQTISIHLLPPITPRGPPAAAVRGGATGGSLLSRISGGGANTPAALRGAPRGRGGPVRGRGGPVGRGGGARRGPTNAGDLDKELDGFMGQGAVAAGDVEMS